MIRLLRLRRLIQVAVLLLLAALPWLNRDGFTGMKGSLFAFDFFGLPFADPLGAVQIGLSGIIPGWRLIAGARVVLAVALCLGRIFCSWFCPFGFLSELVHAIRGRRPPKPFKYGFWSRAVIALVGLALVPLLGFPLHNQLSLPGGLSLMGPPIEQYPNIVPPTNKMQATYPGAIAETVANSVASPIQQSISGVVGMDNMTSTNANNGICYLSIVFAVGTDPNMDQTLAYMRYGQATAQIPAEVSQMGITITQSTGSPLAVINLYSPDDSLNAIFLSNYAYVSLVDPVKRVPGVGDVQVFGAGRYAMRIWLDTTKMAAQNISVGEVQSAIQAQNTVIPGGQIGAEPAPPGT